MAGPAAYPASGALAVLLLAAGCAPTPPPMALDYRIQAEPAPLVLTFSHDQAGLSQADLATLQQIRDALPVQTLPELYAIGPFAMRRAYAVRAVLGRPVSVYPADALPQGLLASADDVILRLPVPNGIVPDTCRGAGEFGPAGLWPGDDARRQRLLPPGCAVATSIAAQAANTSDLLRGRALPPGAASPFADAIERYYQRNVPSAGAGPSSSRGDNGGPSAGDASSGNAASANPLLGALPGASPATR